MTTSVFGQFLCTSTNSGSTENGSPTSIEQFSARKNMAII